MENIDYSKGHSVALYYQGYCRKCQIISKSVVIFSLGVIKRIPLEKDESIQLFFKDYPKAKGSPILFLRRRPFYGYWVFAGVPLGVAYSWVERIGRLLGVRTARPVSPISSPDNSQSQ